MAEKLTEEEFSKHLNTQFRLEQLDGAPLELELVEVKSYRPEENVNGKMERFSIYLKGPAKPYLPQQTYSLSHDQMGQFDIFLVPISNSPGGLYYEAVFNFYK